MYHQGRRYVPIDKQLQENGQRLLRMSNGCHMSFIFTRVHPKIVPTIMQSLDLLLIWLAASSLAALQARYVTFHTTFDFPFTIDLLTALASWILAAVVKLVFNKGDTVKEALKEDIDHGRQLHKLLLYSGVLLGAGTAAKGLLQTFPLQQVPFVMACSPAAVYMLSLIMNLEPSRWQHPIQVIAVCGGASAALFTSTPTISSWAEGAGPALQAMQLLCVSTAACMLFKAVRAVSGSSSRASTPKSSGSSSSGGRSSSGSLDDDGCVMQSAAVVITYVAPVAAAVMLIPAVVFEGPRLFATYYGWQGAVPAVLGTTAAAAVSNVLTLKVIQLTSAATVAMSKVTAGSVLFILCELHSPMVLVKIPGEALPTVNLVGCATAVLAMMWYTLSRLHRAIQRQHSEHLPHMKNEAFWAKKDPASVLNCTGTDAMVYVQHHRYKAAKETASNLPRQRSSQLSPQGSCQLSPQGSFQLHSMTSTPAWHHQYPEQCHPAAALYGAVPTAAAVATAAAAVPTAVQKLSAVQQIAHGEVPSYQQLPSYRQPGLAY